MCFRTVDLLCIFRPVSFHQSRVSVMMLGELLVKANELLDVEESRGHISGCYYCKHGDVVKQHCYSFGLWNWGIFQMILVFLLLHSHRHRENKHPAAISTSAVG